MLALLLPTMALFVVTYAALHHQRHVVEPGRSSLPATDSTGQLCDFSRQPYQVSIMGITSKAGRTAKLEVPKPVRSCLLKPALGFWRSCPQTSS